MFSQSENLFQKHEEQEETKSCYAMWNILSP